MKTLILAVSILLATTALADTGKISLSDVLPLPQGKVRAQIITQIAQLLQQAGHGNACLQGVGQLTQLELAGRLYSCLGSIPAKKVTK